LKYLKKISKYNFKLILRKIEEKLGINLKENKLIFVNYFLRKLKEN
jgi:hypothetical protein